MEDIEFEEFVHVRPKPGLSLSASRRVPSLANQACQYLQKRFRRRMGKALYARDVAELTCAIVLVAVIADILYTLCPRKRKTVRSQELCAWDGGAKGFLSTSERSHCLGNVIASFMVQITWPTSILEAVRNAKLYGLAGSKFVPANSALIHNIFVLLLLEFRTKAPGAQTNAQFVGHRFGLVAHILTIIISLLVSLYTLTVNITKGSMVLNAVTMNVGEGAIVSLVLLQVGALLVVARRRSCSLILFAILTSIRLICATLTFNMLNSPDSTDLGMRIDLNPSQEASHSDAGNMGSLYKLLMCYNRSDHELEGALASGFDVAILSDGLISLIFNILWGRLSRAALLIGYSVSAGASLTLWLVLDRTSSLGTF
ncbi:unnamed protein product [Taenia asiatica]|uniref:Rhomboid-like protein n=1 Tax=Taenia asiatica TaxID=60517 RepID=A0A0R3WGA6_TAEAS|nr:unnamed protein product [Taenia asiatica]